MSFAQLLTSAGPAAIAVIRLVGSRSRDFLERHVQLHGSTRLTPGAFRRATLLDADGSPLDDILICCHDNSSAGEWRLHLHGSPWLVQRCVQLLENAGLPRTPDFRAAPLWPAADELEADAHACLGSVLTLRGARWLLENVVRLRDSLRRVASPLDIEAARAALAELSSAPPVLDWFVRPLRVALVGPPNAGKSTLANTLAGRGVSIVSTTPGTTRDAVESRGEADGFPVAWLDTAGLRETSDALEAAGIDQTRRVIAGADAVIVVLDGRPGEVHVASAFVASYPDTQPAAVALNKCELAAGDDAVRRALPASWSERAVDVSAALPIGVAPLTATLMAAIGRTALSLERPTPFTPAQRAAIQLATAETSRKRMLQSILRVVGLSESARP